VSREERLSEESPLSKKETDAAWGALIAITLWAKILVPAVSLLLKELEK
jgi:hypothetical protein